MRRLLLVLLSASSTALQYAPATRKFIRRSSARMAMVETEGISTVATEALEAASDAASTAVAAIDPIVDGAADLVTSAAPVVKGAAQIGLGAAQLGFEVGKKTVEVAGPVVIEGSKAALPVISGGIRAASNAIETGSVAVEPTPIDLDAFASSPLAAALANAAPWALGVLVVYLSGQLLLQRVKDTIGPLVYPAISVGVLGVVFTAVLKLGLIDL